jgi:hypothetical protein
MFGTILIMKFIEKMTGGGPMVSRPHTVPVVKQYDYGRRDPVTRERVLSPIGNYPTAAEIARHARTGQTGWKPTGPLTGATPTSYGGFKTRRSTPIPTDYYTTEYHRLTRVWIQCKINCGDNRDCKKQCTVTYKAALQTLKDEHGP